MDRRFLLSGLAAALAACALGSRQVSAQRQRDSAPNNLIVSFKQQGKARDRQKAGGGRGGRGAGGRGRFGGRPGDGRPGAGRGGMMRRRMRMMRMRRRMMMRRWRGVYG